MGWGKVLAAAMCCLGVMASGGDAPLCPHWALGGISESTSSGDKNDPDAFRISWSRMTPGSRPPPPQLLCGRPDRRRSPTAPLQSIKFGSDVVSVSDIRKQRRVSLIPIEPGAPRQLVARRPGTSTAGCNISVPIRAIRARGGTQPRCKTPCTMHSRNRDIDPR